MTNMLILNKCRKCERTYALTELNIDVDPRKIVTRMVDDCGNCQLAQDKEKEEWEKEQIAEIEEQGMMSRYDIERGK